MRQLLWTYFFEGPDNHNDAIKFLIAYEEEFHRSRSIDKKFKLNTELRVSIPKSLESIREYDDVYSVIIEITAYDDSE